MNLIKLLASFFMGSVFARLIGFILIPVYTTFLTPNQYGYFDISILIITLVSSVIYSEVWVAVMRNMLLTQESVAQNKIVSNGLILFLVSTTLFSLAALLVGGLLSLDFVVYIWLVGLTNALKEFYSFVARGFGRSGLFALSGAINAAVMASVSVLLLITSNMQLASLYIGLIVGNVIQVLILEPTCRIFRVRRNLVNADTIKDLLKFTFPLGLNSFLYWFLTGTNRIVVSLMFGMTAAGLFAVGARFGALVSLFAGVITMVWQELSFSKQGNERTYFTLAAQNITIFFLIAGIVSLPVVFWFFDVMVDNKYSEAKNTLSLFIAVAVFNAVSTFIGNIFYAAQRTRGLLATTITSATILSVGVVPLTYFWGMNGANVAVLLSLIGGISHKLYLLRDLITLVNVRFDIVLLTLYFSLLSITFTLVGGLYGWILSVFLIIHIGLRYTRRFYRLLIHRSVSTE